MSAPILSVLAAASLMASGVTATTETRSSQSFPTQKVALVAGAADAKTGPCLAAVKGAKARLIGRSAKASANCTAGNAALGVGMSYDGAAPAGSTYLSQSAVNALITAGAAVAGSVAGYYIVGANNKVTFVSPA